MNHQGDFDTASLESIDEIQFVVQKDEAINIRQSHNRDLNLYSAKKISQGNDQNSSPVNSD